MRITAYNPGALERDDAVRGFVARRVVFERISEDLARERPQHRILIGQRGMGKSTLLRRLYFAIREDQTLSERWIALSFREEQYNLRSLADFWLNCIEALDESLRPSDSSAQYTTKLEREIESIKQLTDAKIEREARRVLEREIETSKRGLCLLVDNVDLLFERLSDDELWKLREVLSSSQLLLIGGSAVSHPATYEYKRPFYDFFQTEQLGGLDDRETREMLTLLSELRDTPEVVTAMVSDPGRISTLRVLSGGNPRAIVLVHQLLSRRDEHDVVDDVTALLDMCTPLYKARFEALSTQAQLIVDAMCRAWDPVTAARVAKDTRLDVNAVSSQLSRLVHDGFVEQVKYPGARKGFQIAERLFNIWYLMRLGSRARRKLVWLVEFLRAFYGPGHVAAKAGELAKVGGSGPPELFLAYALATEDLFARRALELRGLEALVAQASNPLTALANALDLKGDDKHLQSLAARLATKQRICEILGSCDPLSDGTPFAEAVLSLALPMQVRGAFAEIALNPGGAELLRNEIEGLHKIQPKGVDALRRAVESGRLDMVRPLNVDDIRALKDLDHEAFVAATIFAILDAQDGAMLTALQYLVLATQDMNAWVMWFEQAGIFGADISRTFLSTLQPADLPKNIEIICWILAEEYLCESFLVARFIHAENPKDSVSRLLKLGEPCPTMKIAEGMAALLSVGRYPWTEIRSKLIARSSWSKTDVDLLARFSSRGNHAQQGVELMDELGLSDMHRPVREALLAVANGSDHLLTVAPEIREPAQKILTWITFDPTGERASNPPAARAAAGATKRSRTTTRGPEKRAKR
jgi:hypothetical protein